MHPALWNWKFQAVYYLHWFLVSWIVFSLSPESNKVNRKFVFWLFMCLASTSDSYSNVHNFYWKKNSVWYTFSIIVQGKKLFLWLGSVWPRVKFSIQFLLYQIILLKNPSFTFENNQVDVTVTQDTSSFSDAHRLTNNRFSL